MQASFQRLFPNISNPHKFGHSCSILENNVLMHQCAISAKDIKINSLSHPSIVFTPSSFSPVPGGQKPQKGTNGRCSTIVEESNGLTNSLLITSFDLIMNVELRFSVQSIEFFLVNILSVLHGKVPLKRHE